MAKWTDEDIKLMREQFNTLGGREMHRLMPHHSREAIVEYATSTLGIRKRSRSSQARSRHPAPTPKSQFPTDYKPSTIPAESIAAKAEALKAKYGTYNDGRRDLRREVNT